MIDFQEPPPHRPADDAKTQTRPESRKRPPAPTIAVRYGLMNHIGEFGMSRSMPTYFASGTKLVIQTTRGVEIGEPVNNTCTSCKNCVPKADMRTYVKNSGSDFLKSRAGRVLRVATSDDLIEERHIVGQKDDKMRLCREIIARHDLKMKLVDCEHVFGGERILFFFMADTRVDFRSLVRDLASEYQTRIEMRQVGARDEARLIADYETCGRECCCKNFLKTLRPVSMRNAKMQKATLDPSKVSGRCGRLKCCLRYEQENYEYLNKRLPKVGKKVTTPDGPGVVVDRQIITQLVKVRRDDGQVFACPVEQLDGGDGGAERGDKAVAGDAAVAPGPQDIEDDWTLMSADTRSKPSPTPPGSAPRGAPDAAAADADRPDTPQGASEGPKRRRRRRGRRGRRSGPSQPPKS